MSTSFFPYRPASTPKPAQRTARETVLADWRGIDLGPQERAQAAGARPVGEILSGVVNHLGLDRRRAEAEVFKAWSHLLDPTIAAHARPAGLRNGTLFVDVDSSVWLGEIVRYRRREILARLQNAFGRELVTKISFRVG